MKSTETSHEISEKEETYPPETSTTSCNKIIRQTELEIQFNSHPGQKEKRKTLKQKKKRKKTNKEILYFFFLTRPWERITLCVLQHSKATLTNLALILGNACEIGALEKKPSQE